MADKSVTIVIVTYNSAKFTENCLRSVQKLDTGRQNFDVVIVDNNSADATLREVRGNFPGIKIIENKINLGFAGANNVAIKEIKTKYVALLNPDTEVDNAWLSELVNIAESDPKIGMVGSKVLSLKDRKTVLSYGVTLCKSGRAIETIDAGMEPFCPSGVSTLYRKELLDSVGALDGDFFAYFEDVDLAWRAKRAGWKCAYACKSIVYHHVSANWIYGSPAQMYYCIRNRLWTIAKNWPASYILRYSFFFSSMALFQAFYVLLKSKSIRGFSALADCIKGLPRMIKRRKLNDSKPSLTPVFIPFSMELKLLGTKHK